MEVQIEVKLEISRLNKHFTPLTRSFLIHLSIVKLPGVNFINIFRAFCRYVGAKKLPSCAKRFLTKFWQQKRAFVQKSVRKMLMKLTTVRGSTLFGFLK